MDEYWQKILRRYGRHLLFLDTGAIVGTLDCGDERFREFLYKEAVGYTFITSTYVVAETVRRLVKSKKTARFRGPTGETTWALARYVLKEWLDQNQVRVLPVPDEVYDNARDRYCLTLMVQCDLTDLISYTIANGLSVDIVTDDDHFRELGISCLP